MRLGFYHHLTIDQKQDSLFVIGHFGRFLDGLAQHCDELVLFMHEPESPDSFHDYPLQHNNISWVSMGFPRSAPFRSAFYNSYKRIVRKHLDKIDSLLIRGPSPLLPGLASLSDKLPVVLMLGGDYLAGVDSLPQPFFRKELIRLWSKYYNKCQLKAAKKCLTMVNSRKLYDEYQPYLRNLVEIKTTTLTDTDFYERQDTCLQAPYHLLYTGRMDRAKGLLDVLEALKLLTDQGIDIVFDLVGKVEVGDPVLEDMNNRAEDMGIADRVDYHGFKSIGNELFDFYKKADIFIVASKASFEGFPRAIWEALAHSLPVIATNVSSIPFNLKNEKDAILIDPNDPKAISNAVVKVISNSKLRKNIITNGFQLARENTIENRSLELLNHIDHWRNLWVKDRR